MIIVNVNSKASDIIRQLFELANREKDGVLVNDSTGDIYTISKVKQIGSLEETPSGLLEKIKKTIEEECEPIIPQYQEQLSSEEFRERLRDPGAENNYNIDKFIEETEQLYGEYREPQQEENNEPDATPSADYEKVNIVELLEKLIPEEECISDEEFEEAEREYEEYMKRKQAEEAAQKTKKRGRPRKIKASEESGSEPIPF